MKDDTYFLHKAIEKAKESVAQGGFPAGAVVVKDGEVIGSGISVGNILNDPTSHGEISAIRNACKNLSSSDLSGSVLYASMEPCSMCHSASAWSSVSKIIFACSKEMVSAEYYAGNYKTEDLNNTLLQPLEIAHLKKLEEGSYQIVMDWESSLAE